MNLPRHALRINVGFLLNAPYGYNRDIHFDFPLVKFEDDFELNKFKGVVRVSRTPQGIVVESNFQGQIEAECARCLRSFDLTLQTEFSDLYAFDNRSTTESDLVLRDDANIDLADLVREYLLVEEPISPLCRPDCRGLCPECGEDLNITTCEHAAQQSF